MIRKIRLKNWKSHKQSELEFRKGTNVLTGIIGAGKSTVVEALCYALFGTYPALKSNSVNLNEIIMNKPNQMEEAKVELEFDYNEKNYLIERTVFLGKNANQAKIFEEGRLLAGPKPKDVNEKINEIIEMNYDLFSRAVYSEQNQIDFFLKLDPSTRKKKFDEILDLEKYEKARKTNITVKNRIKKIAEEKEELIKKNTDLIDEKALKELNEKKELKEKRMKELEEEKEAKEKELEQNLKKIKELEEKEKKFKNLNEKAIKTESKITETEKKLKEEEIEIKEGEKEKQEKKLTELKKEKKEIEVKKKEFSAIQVKFNTQKEKKNLIGKEQEKKKELIPEEITSKEKMEEKTREKETELNEIKKMIQENEKRTEEEEKNLIELKEGLLSNEKKIKELEENIKKLSKAEADCPVCSTKLSKEKKIEIINSTEKQIKYFKELINKGLKEEKQKSREKLDKTRKEKKEAEEKEKKLKEEKEKIGLLKEVFDEIKEREKQIEELEKEINKLEESMKQKEKEFDEKKIEELEKNIKKSEKIIDLFKEVEKLEEWKKELTETMEEKKKLDYKENEFSEKKEELAKTNALISSLEKEKENSIELIESIKLNIKKIEQEKEKIEQTKKELELYEKTLDKLTLFNNALNQTQAELRKEMIDTINEAMDDVWNRVYPYGDFTSAKMEIEEGNYEIKVKEKNGKWTRVEGILSGGERSAAAICIRVAFSLVLTQNLSWLILDEPTHNLDRNAVIELSKMMREHLPNLVEQIFVITHDSEMEKAASGKCYEIERDKENEGSSIPKTTETN